MLQLHSTFRPNGGPCKPAGGPNWQASPAVLKGNVRDYIDEKITRSQTACSYLASITVCHS